MTDRPVTLLGAVIAATAIPVAVLAAAPVLEQTISERLSPGGELFSVGGVPVSIVFAVLLLLASSAFVLFWLLMLVDCLKRHWPHKIIWLSLLIISLPLGLFWLSAILYYLLVQRRPPSAAPAGPEVAGNTADRHQS